MKKNFLILVSSILWFGVAFGQGDICSLATDIGALPTPDGCPGGAGTTFTYNGTTTGATAENPYSSLACMDAPAADVWVSFVASGNELNLDFTSGLANANIGIYSGDCNNLVGLFCEASNNSSINTTLQPFTPGETYYMQISGQDDTDFGDFTLELTNFTNCGACVLATGLTATPAPTNGYYLPGTTVQFCLNITEYVQVSTNWLHGILPSFGGGWDLSTLTPVSSPNASGIYDWIWIDPPGGDPLGWWVDDAPYGPATGDGNPTNNYGDIGVSGNGNWTWCWEITVDAACTPGADLGITVNTTADGETGSWTSAACQGDGDVPFVASMICCGVPLITSVDETCPGAMNGSATVEGQDGDAPYDYVWELGGATIYTDNNNAGVSSLGGLGTGTYTVTVTDNNGCIQIVDVIILSTACPFPTFDPEPVDITVQCIGDVPAMTNLIWNDACAGTGGIAGTDAPLVGNTCGGTITRTWTYTNPCGNSVNATQIITINDNITPVFAAPPADVVVECEGDVPAMIDLAWTDNCDGAGTVTGTDGPLIGGNCGGTILRTWTYTDACGNTATVTQTITVDDTTPPTGVPPVPIAVVGIGAVPPCNILDVTLVADNCTVNPVVVCVGDVSDGGSCPEIITRTYSITDDCGNTIDVIQIITVGDALFPTASNPSDINVECLADVPGQNPAVVTDEADNGGAPVVTWEDDVMGGGACPDTLLRRYRVTDDCGNFIFVTQNIIMEPATVLVVAADGSSTVDCLADAQVQPVAAAVMDVCGNVLIPVVTTPVNIVCEGDMDWIFTYTDCAGNTADWVYTYTIYVVTLPVVPANATELVVCFDEVYVPTAPIVADVCGNNIVGVMTEGPDPVCVGDKVYTFTYTDCAGNISVYTYTFSINDNVLPTAPNLVDTSVAGSMDVPAPNILDVINEADNCTVNPIVAWVSDVSDGNICNLEEITRTYSVTDDCGNQIFVTQVITILAVPAPIDAGPDQTICSGDLVTIVADNPWGVPTDWSPAVPNGPFDPIVTTTYTLTADNLGCLSTDDVTVIVEPLPVMCFYGDILSGCEPLTVVFTNTSTAPSGITDCEWSFGGQSGSGCGPITYIFQNGGTYDVTLTTTSATGCENTITYDDYIYVEEIPVAAFSPSSNSLTIMNTEVDFMNNSTGASDYQWTFGDDSGTSFVENPNHVYPTEEGVSYTVQLIALSPLLCADTAWASINIIEEVIFYLPNTFTPDGDAYNEYFQPVFTSGYDPYDFDLSLFNRWGELIWESHNVDIGWDGTYGSGQKIVQDGTYTWRIEFKTSENDKRVLVTGHVNIIR